MKYIQNEDIQGELKKRGRTYLIGKLERATDLNYIETDGAEIGISSYSDFKSDSAHFHHWNQEYNLILNGEMKVYIFHENKEYHLKEGDFFNIEPNVSYMTKALPGTTVLFAKFPGGNDKELFDISSNNAWIEWTKKW